MPDLRLKSLEIRNWMTVKSARIEFPEKGLVLVIGSNLASDGKLASVGSGKTAMGEALARTLLGVTGRYTHVGYYLSDTSKNDMYVAVNATLLDKPLKVELGFRCKELVGDGEALRFTHGSAAPVQGARVDQTRALLQKTLQVTPELADWTAFIDGDRLKFNKMSQEDSVNLLMSSLAQPPWTEYFAYAARKLQAANRQVLLSNQALESARYNVQTAKEDLGQAQDEYLAAQDAYKRQVAELDQTIAKVKEQIAVERAVVVVAKVRLLEIKEELKALEEAKAVQNHQWEIEQGGLRDDLAELDLVREKAATVRDQLQTQWEEAGEAVQTMLKVPKNCPKCGKPWDKAHGEQEIAKARDKVMDLDKKLQAAEVVCDGYNAKRKQIREKLQQLDEKLREVGQVQKTRSLGDEYARTEIKVNNLNATVHQRELNLVQLAQGVDVTFVNKKLAVVQERQRLLDANTAAVDGKAADLALDEETLKVVQYWHKAFGPTGIPNMILTDAVPLLNRVAQRISSLMTGGTLQVTYSTTKELVSGESRAALVTKVVNRIGSKRLEGSSKGEGGLTNLIIAENLNELGQVSNRVGFRFYDEITSGQDATVRRSIFAYLKEVAQRLGILIFVVDHHPEAQNYSDYTLLATKTRERGTTYSWQ